MIDEKIMDEVLPIPTVEELRDKEVAELQEEGFVITNFHPGGVWYTLLMLCIRVKIELCILARTILNQMSVVHASGAWLDIKAADYSKKRKQAQKTRGYVTLSRQSAGGEAVKVPKGHIFKTAKDINGEELRYFVLEASVLQKGADSAGILVEAEKEGSRYNVPQGQITRSLTYLGEVLITNTEGWMTREGSDTEDDESLRARVLRSWSELARVAIHDTYVNICEAIPGVLYVTVNDKHPRGQGTVDVIVTSEAGAATEALLDDCRAACETVKAPDDDILVKSAETVTQPIALTVTVPDATNRDGLEDRVAASISDFFKISKSRVLNELTHADLIFKVKSDVTGVRNVTITSPAADLFLSTDKVILPGEITVTVQGV